MTKLSDIQANEKQITVIRSAKGHILAGIHDMNEISTAKSFRSLGTNLPFCILFRKGAVGSRLAHSTVIVVPLFCLNIIRKILK